MKDKRINIVQIEGRCTQDIEKVETKNGKVIAKFTLAYDSFMQTDDEGSYASFVKVICYTDIAIFALDKLEKGMQIFLQGKLLQRRFVDKNNNKKSYFQIVAQNILVTDLNNRPNLETQSSMERSLV